MIPLLNLSIEALEKGPVHLFGELPGGFLELDGEVSIRNISPVRFDLHAEMKGREVLVTGNIEAAMELECVRSGAFFSTIVRDSAFLRDYSMREEGESLNLAEDVREAVILQIPAYPVSPEAQSADFELPKLPGTPGDNPENHGATPWSDLDQLNL